MRYNTAQMPNPFIYSEPVSPENLLDRDDEAVRLLERAVGSHNSRLVAPRRYGKTSLLRRVLRDVENDGFTPVYVSFFGVLSAADIAQRIERAYAEQLTGRLAAWFAAVRRSLRPTLGVQAGVPGVAGGQLSVSPVPAEQSVLDRPGDAAQVATSSCGARPHRLRRVPGRAQRLRVGARRHPVGISSITARPPATSSPARTSA